VSVILPTIGRLDYFEDTRRSVDSQSFRDFEVVVLDNASPAPAMNAFRKWAAEDSRLRIMRIESRLPMFPNFNRGIAAARGKYIAFVHDDDVYDPNYVRTAVEALEQNPSAAFCGSNYQFIDERGRVTEDRRWIRKTRLVGGKAYIERMLRGARSFIPTPGLVFRRDAIQHGFDADLSLHYGDFVWLMRIAERGDVILLTDVLVRIRRHDAQESRSMGMSAAIPTRTQTLLDYCAEYVERHPDDQGFIERMKERILLVHRLGLLYGWAVAADESEARACAGALGGGRLDRGLRPMLLGIERAPLRQAMSRGRAVLRRVTSRVAF